MRRLLTPNLAVHRLEQIDPAVLTRWGVKGVIVDLDNTLLPWDSQDIPDQSRQWVEMLKDAGFQMCLLSNNSMARIRSLCGLLGVPGVWSAGKPFPFGFARARRHLSLPASRCVVIGDQLFTDVLGGNLYGYRTILVRPMSRKELRWTRLMRWLERCSGRAALEEECPPESPHER